MTREQLASELEKLPKDVLAVMFAAQRDVRLPRGLTGPSKQDLAVALATYLDRKDFCRAYILR